MSEEEKKLDQIVERLDKLIEMEQKRFAAPIGPRPEIDLFNEGKFIVNKRLPAGKWTDVWEILGPPCPLMIYWKIVITDSPNIRCLCFQEGLPVCDTGCDLAALWTLGITSFNDRGWVHIYDTTNNIYGLQCNILRPIRRHYKYQIQNYDSVDHNLIVCYPKWYKWPQAPV